MECFKVKRKIKRNKPNKKWMEAEIKAILNYLQEVSEIEAPTAQIYYKKLIEETSIDATWDLIRWKVRHLKTCFKKANEWLQSTDASLLERDMGISYVEGKVLQMCPHYKQLAKIFGEKTRGESAWVSFDSGDTTSMDESFTTIMNEAMQQSSGFADSVDEVMYSTIMKIERASSTEEICNNTEDERLSPAQPIEDPIAIASVPTILPKKVNDFDETIKTHAPKSSSALLAGFQADRTSLFKMKLDWEKEKHSIEFRLNERKLKLEEEKTKAEIDIRKEELELKRLEIERDGQLKILEIERDERLKKYEIELKYKKKT